MNEWWLYFGNIAPSKIVEFIVEEAIPYRPVPGRTIKTQEAVTGAEAVTALIAVHSVQCGWQGRDRWSPQSVNGMLTAR